MRLDSDLSRASVLGLFAAGGALFACLVQSTILLDAAVLFFYFLLLSASWNLLAGYLGQMSFGHVGLAVAGAYISAGLSNLELPVAASMLIAAFATAAVGLVIGAITLRLRTIYFSLATFAIAGVFISWLTGATNITGGSNGLIAMPLVLVDPERTFVWLGLGLSILFFGLQWILLSSRWGILLRAVRDREDVANGLGVRVTMVKVATFTYTAFWAGAAGAFYAAYVGFITPSLGAISNIGLVIAMAVVGGLGTMTGPIVGTLLVRIIEYYTRGYGGEFTLLIFSAILLAIMLFMRDGIVGLFERAAMRFGGRRDRWAAPSGSQLSGGRE